MLRGLHKLCDKGQWDQTISQLRSNPAAPSTATSRSGWGEWTPLHIACKRDPPVEVIIALLEAAPETACLNDMSQRYPLHHAAEWGASVDVLATLYDAYPRGVLAMDNDGRTPLHLAVMRCCGDGHGGGGGQQRGGGPPPGSRSPPNQLEVELLLDGGEENVASMADNEGNTPLHCACESIDEFTDVNVLETLVNACPDALLTPNMEGQTPLHLALLKSVESPASTAVIQVLMGNSRGIQRDVLEISDEEGRLPLHCACKNFASFEVLHELLSNNREAARIKALDGTYPLDILEEMRPSIVSDEEIEELNYKSDLLFAHFPDIAPYRTELKRLERLEDLIIFEIQTEKSLSLVGTSVWTWLCTFPEEGDPEELYSTAVSNIVTKIGDPDTIRILAEIKTSPETVAAGVGGAAGSRSIREVASAKCAEILQPYFRFVDNYEFMDESTGLVEPLHRNPTSLYIRVREHSYSSEGNESSRIVVMKFSSDASQFNKELMMHKQLYGITGVATLRRHFDIDRIGTRSEEASDVVFAQSLERRAESTPYDLSPYRHALVFPLGDRSLESIWQHEKLSSSMTEIKGVLRDVGNVMKEVHTRNIMYGDLHLGNLLRIENVLHLTSISSAYQVPMDALGGVSSDMGLKHTSILPPEMFAKVHSDMALRKYKNYYKTIQDDAAIFTMLSDGRISDNDTLHISYTVNSFLLNSTGRFQQASFDDLYQRFQNSSQLWGVLKPRSSQDGSSTVVVKSYFMDEATGAPLQPSLLPYKIEAASPSFDIWTFGILMYQLHAGISLFSQDRGLNLIRAGDYFRLCDWSSEMLEEVLVPDNDEDSSIDDPLVRDLLRKILVSRESRVTSMEEVLSHPYFDDEGESLDAEMLRAQIVEHEEEARLLKRRSETEKKEYNEWKARTCLTLEKTSMNTMLKLSRSTTAQWKGLCPNLFPNGDEQQQEEQLSLVMVPSSFIVLPYELDHNSIAQDQQMARLLSIRLVDAFHAIGVLAEMSRRNVVSRDDREVLKRKVKEYLDFNNGLQNPAAERKDAQQQQDSSSPLALCEWLLQRYENAVRFLTEILSYYLPEDNNNNSMSSSLLCASSYAKKLILDIFPTYISLEDCTVILQKAKDAEGAFSALEKVSPQDLGTVKQIYYEQCFANDTETMLEQLAADKASIDEKLLNIIKAFANDGPEIMRKITSDKVVELLELYDSGASLYLVDEYTGVPIVTDCEGYFGLVESVRDFLPAMRLAVKSVCSLGTVLGGMKVIVGMSEEDHEWREMLSRCTVGQWPVNSSNEGTINAVSAAERDEYYIFYDMLHGSTTSGVAARPEDDILRWEMFVTDRDPERCYTGLKRLSAPGGGGGMSSLWTLESSKDLMDAEWEKSLIEYAVKQEVDICKQVHEDLRLKRVERSKDRCDEREGDTVENTDAPHEMETTQNGARNGAITVTTTKREAVPDYIECVTPPIPDAHDDTPPHANVNAPSDASVTTEVLYYAQTNNKTSSNQLSVTAPTPPASSNRMRSLRPSTLGGKGTDGSSSSGGRVNRFARTPRVSAPSPRGASRNNRFAGGDVNDSDVVKENNASNGNVHSSFQPPLPPSDYPGKDAKTNIPEENSTSRRIRSSSLRSTRSSSRQMTVNSTTDRTGGNTAIPPSPRANVGVPQSPRMSGNVAPPTPSRGGGWQNRMVNGNQSNRFSSSVSTTSNSENSSAKSAEMSVGGFDNNDVSPRQSNDGPTSRRMMIPPGAPVPSQPNNGGTSRGSSGSVSGAPSHSKSGGTPSWKSRLGSSRLNDASSVSSSATGTTAPPSEMSSRNGSTSRQTTQFSGMSAPSPRHGLSAPSPRHGHMSQQQPKENRFLKSPRVGGGGGPSNNIAAPSPRRSMAPPSSMRGGQPRLNRFKM